MTLTARLFSSPPLIFTLAVALRLILLLWGIHQDATSPFKYTDIDYFVFTDASLALSRGQSPYSRATYRYTPLLAWLLYPTTFSPSRLWFSCGKVLFALSDILAGYLLYILLQRRGLSPTRSLKYASVWLLNPMVANISTRGSSEGLLCALVLALLHAFTTSRIRLAGILLGLAVHLKIYPFIYGASMLWALPSSRPATKNPTPLHRFLTLYTPTRFTLLTSSLITFTLLNTVMYALYGPEFLRHTFLHHLTRLDHRHNFSPYNTLLYLQSATSTSTSSTPSSSVFTSLSRLAFLPQLTLSTLLLPLLARHDLPSTMLAQTLAFATFNKVATSQYFLWYLIFLPLYLPDSSLIRRPKLGISVLSLWVGAQAAWLGFAYRLEFLGVSTFFPGLWACGVAFFAVNCWVCGIVVGDITGRVGEGNEEVEDSSKGNVVEKEVEGEKSSGSVEGVEGEPGPAVDTTPRKDVKRRHGGTPAGERTRSLRSAVDMS